MTGYTILMWAYNALALFIVAALVYNLFKCKVFWEQVIAFLAASKLHADALVVECMALSPETIRVADELLAPGHVSLTGLKPSIEPRQQLARA